MSGVDRVVPRFEPSAADGVSYAEAKKANDEAALQQRYSNQRRHSKAAVTTNETVQPLAPMQLRFLLDIHEGVPSVHLGTQFYAVTAGTFLSRGLIRAGLDGPYVLTPKGEAFMRMLLSTPLPEQSFSDPRTGKRV